MKNRNPLTRQTTKAIDYNFMGGATRVLDTNDRTSEVLFGLIMVLTFTGSLSIADSGRDDVRTMLIGALGCNLAWGIIDGIFYLMAVFAEKSQALRTFHAARKSTDTREANLIVAEALPKIVASVMTQDELQSIHQRLIKLPEPPTRARLSKQDWLGALGVCLLVFVSTFPVAVPFIFVERLALAMRISNTIAVAMLFFTGLAYGRHTGHRPWLVGAGMVVVGIVIVAMTIALGG